MNINVLVLQHLKQLRKNGPMLRGSGICANIQHQIYKNEDLLLAGRAAGITACMSEHWVNWSKFSGKLEFPVAAPTEYVEKFKALGPQFKGDTAHKMAYRQIENCWEGSYGEDRWELLTFLIDSIERQCRVERLMLKALRSLQEQGAHYKHAGICNNIYRADLELYDLVYRRSPADYAFEDAFRQTMRTLFQAWPKFSGDLTYPVPHPTFSPMDAFDFGDDLWIGEYGQNRRELMQFMINQLEERWGTTSA